jgi:hypothetical protein
MLAVLLAAGLVRAASAQPLPERFRATVMAREGDTLTLSTHAGRTLTATLSPATIVTEIVPANLSDLAKGSFIGTAAMPGPNGALVAIEVHIFPEAMRGTGEGYRPYDLQPESTMTNGTVGDITVADGRTLHVGYKGGEKTVLVPEGTPIVAFAPGRRDMLVEGAHVILFATKAADGGYAAIRILVGKDGMVPPM